LIQQLLPFAYLAALILSIFGLYLIDRRHKLAITGSPRAALLSIAVAVALFLIWDLAGIALGIFLEVTLLISRVWCSPQSCQSKKCFS